jgi:hypothetical protein
VITNIPFTRRVEGVFVVSDAELSPGRLVQTVDEFRSRFSSRGVLVVVDEASIHWDSRDWSKVSGEVRGWLATVGHRGVSLVVVGQSVAMIDPTMRRLARFVVEHRDATGGFMGLFTSDVRVWTLLEGINESWTAVREKGWFVVGPGLPYVSAEVFRGNVVSGFGARVVGVIGLLVILYVSVIYGSRCAVLVRQKLGGTSRLFGERSLEPRGVVDPFGVEVRVCGVVEDGTLIECDSGEFRVVPVRVSESLVGERVALGKLLGAAWGRVEKGKVK